VQAGKQKGKKHEEAYAERDWVAEYTSWETIVPWRGAGAAKNTAQKPGEKPK